LVILPCTSPCAARHSGGAKNTPFWIFIAVVDRLEDADHLDAVPGELPRPRSIRLLDRPRGRAVKPGDAAVISSMPLNGDGIRACGGYDNKGSRHPPEGRLVVHIALV